jgi:hypothetical protein
MMRGALPSHFAGLPYKKFSAVNARAETLHNFAVWQMAFWSADTIWGLPMFVKGDGSRIHDHHDKTQRTDSEVLGKNACNRKQTMPKMRGNRLRIDFEGSEDAVPESETNYPGSSAAWSLALHSKLR